MTTGKQYDDPNNTIRREYFSRQLGAASATEYHPFRSWQKCRLIAAHYTVVTAGTAAARMFQVYHDGTVLSSVSLGTAVAGVTVSLTGLARTVGSLTAVTTQFDLGAVGGGDVIYEFEVLPDAVLSE